MNTLFLWLDVARFAPLLVVMAYAAYKDYRTGEVPNKVWLYGAIGGSLTAIANIAYFNIALIFIELLYIGLALVGSFIFYLSGGWGGADLKAVIMLSVSAPLFPLWSSAWLFPLTLVSAFFFGSLSALVFSILFHPKDKQPFWKRKIQFIPFMFIGLLICMV